MYLPYFLLVHGPSRPLFNCSKVEYCKNLIGQNWACVERKLGRTGACQIWKFRRRSKTQRNPSLINARPAFDRIIIFVSQLPISIFVSYESDWIKQMAPRGIKFKTKLPLLALWFYLSSSSSSEGNKRRRQVNSMIRRLTSLFAARIRENHLRLVSSSIPHLRLRLPLNLNHNLKL